MGRREIRELAAAAGRDPDGLAMSVRVEVEVTPGPSSTRAASRAHFPGDPDHMIAAIRAYQDAGVEHVVLALNSADVPRITSLMQTIARRVIPQFR